MTPLNPDPDAALVERVKRGDTRPLPTVRQQQTAQEIAAAGGATVVAYSVEDVKERLRAMHQFTAP